MAYAGLIVASALLANANQSLKSTNAQLDAANRSLTSECSERTNFELDLARQDAVNSKHYQDAVNGQQPYEVRMFMQDSEQPYEVRMFLQNALLPQGEPTDQVGRLLWFGPRLSNVAIPTIKELLDRAAAELTPEKIEQEFPQQPLVQAEILHTVGIAYLYAGRFCQGRRPPRAARSLYKAKLGPDDLETLHTMGNLALAYQAAGKLDLALPLFEETNKLMKAKLGPYHQDTLESLNNLPVKALKAFGLTKQLYLDTLQSMNNLGEAYQEAGKLDLALPLLEETLRLRKAKLGPDHPDTLKSMDNLAEAYEDAGRHDDAIPLLEDALDRATKRPGPFPVQLAWLPLQPLRTPTTGPGGSPRPSRCTARPWTVPPSSSAPTTRSRPA